MGRWAVRVALACALGCGGAPLVSGGRAAPSPAGGEGGAVDAGVDDVRGACGEAPDDGAGDAGAALAAALEAFSEDLATATCHRFVECCTSADMLALVGTSDEAACAADLTEAARDEAQAVLAFGGVAFAPDAAARCVRDVRASPCGAVFEPKAGGLLPCHDVFPGVRRLGDACDDAAMCASDDCEQGACAEKPARPTCLDTETVDALTNTCVALRAAGEACADARPCAPPLWCGDAGTCLARLADGAPCASDAQCPGACVYPADGATRACRPARCQGG